MSSSSYCQGPPSCLEPSHLAEPRVLRLKLSPPKSNISRSPSPCKPDSDCDTKSDENGNNADMGGWSFLQSLNTCKSTKEETNNNDKIYIPPSVKRSSSMLNSKSLEMCTESLGSETGSDVNDSSDEMTLLSPDTNVNQETCNERTNFRETRRTMERSASFPPPLTSISGSTNVQVRPRRQGGRLVLEAVSMTSCRAYFQAERVNGRLRLHLLRNCSPNCEKEEVDINGEHEKAFDDDEEDEVESNDEGEYEGSDGDEDEDDDDDEIREEMLEENNGKGGGEIGMEKLAKARPSRCMEGGSCDGKTLLNNLERFWVAT